jgi:hypothetical protein
MNTIGTKTLLLLLGLFALCTFAQYDEQLALDLVPVCALAYCHKEHILANECKDATRMTQKAGFVVIDALDNDDNVHPITVTLLKRDAEKQIIVAFSGTKNEVTLLAQALQIGPVNYGIHSIKGAKVSKFFYEKYRDQFKAFLNDKLTALCTELSGYDLYFTGHSLGGALATHAAADTLISGTAGKRKTFLYSYGSPRVGNIEFINGWNAGLDGSFRIVHNQDIVPHLPTCFPTVFGGCATGGIFPYYPYHNSQEIYYKDFNKAYVACSMSGEDQNCSNGNLSNLSTSDHSSYFNLPIANLCNTDDHLTSVMDFLKN